MANKIVREIIHAKGIDIGIYTKDFENEYISLTDIAKYRNDNDPRFVIQNWMRNRNTVEFLAVWEELHNPDFNRVQFEAVRSEAGLNRFVMTPTKWIEQTNAIGIVSKAGRYGGGTYAHSDIAMAFATWISPEFQLYIMKDYRRLKQDENSRFSLDWNLNRALSKVNYRIHTDAVKENLIPPELTPEQIAYTYASEADLLNVALFGQTAKQWKNNNPGKKGNVRDDANLNQLLVLANMESYNAILIEQGKSRVSQVITPFDMVTSKTSFNVIPALFNTSFGSLIPWLLPHSFTCVCMKNLLTDRRIYLVYTQKTNLSIPYYHSTNKATCVINLLGSVCAGGPSR